jgi:hypothetical protein
VHKKLRKWYSNLPFHPGLFLKFTGSLASLSHSRAIVIGVALAMQLTAVGKIADAEQSEVGKAAMVAPAILTPVILQLLGKSN